MTDGRPGKRLVDALALEVPCWCEKTLGLVAPAAVRVGVTFSCGQPDCHAPRPAPPPPPQRARAKKKKLRPVRVKPTKPIKMEAAPPRKIGDPCVLCGSTDSERRNSPPVGWFCVDKGPCNYRQRRTRVDTPA